MEEQLKQSAKSQTSGQSREQRVSKIRLGGQWSLLQINTKTLCPWGSGSWETFFFFHSVTQRAAFFPQLIELHLGNEDAVILFVLEMERTVACALQ